MPTSRGTLPLTAGVQQECGPLLRRDTSTTAPNHPHNTDALHSAKRPGAGGRSTPGAWGKHCITQPHSGRTVGGGRRAVEDAPSASWQGGNTPRTPQARGRVLEAEDRDRIADGTGRRLRPSGGMIGSIGGAPLCAQPRLGGWGRLGLGKGYRCVMWLKGHGPSKSGARIKGSKVGMSTHRSRKSGIYPKIALSKGTKRSQIFKFSVLTIFRHFGC